MATYYVRHDGSAANLAAATSPSAASTSMPFATAKTEIASMVSTDILHFSSLGGNYTFSSAGSGTMWEIPDGVTVQGDPAYATIIDYEYNGGANNTIEVFSALDPTNVIIQDFDLRNSATSGIQLGSVGFGGSGNEVNRVKVDGVVGAGGQAFQNLGTVGVTYNDVEGTNCVDDGMSLHDTSTVTINTGTFTGNNQNIAFGGAGGAGIGATLVMNDVTTDGQANTDTDSADIWLSANGGGASLITLTANDCDIGGGVGGATTNAADFTAIFNRTRFRGKDYFRSVALTQNAVINAGNGNANRAPTITCNACIHDTPSGPALGMQQVRIQTGTLSTAADLNNCFLDATTDVAGGVQITTAATEVGSIQNCNFKGHTLAVAAPAGTPIDYCNFDTCTTDTSGGTVGNDTQNASGLVNYPTDLHLADGSLLIGAGDPAATLPANDFDNVVYLVPRSIGAYEYVSSGSPTLTTPYSTQYKVLNDAISFSVATWTGVTSDGYGAINLPIGLEISPQGLITGNLRMGGIIGTTITVTGTDGSVNSAGFNWYITLT